MDRLKELQEAKVAADVVIDKVDHAIRSMEKAASWGLLDTIFGGFLSSAIKRWNIADANNEIKDISIALKSLNSELADVGIDLPKEVSDTTADYIFDVWIDNIFTDIFVQNKISDSLNSLKFFRDEIDKIRERVINEIASYN